MCGITGFFGDGDQNDLTTMTVALAHRGPDADGYFVDTQNRIYLGHRRLTIIDAAGGQQPMSDMSGDVIVTFNGEIYNHIALRRELESLGHRFKSSHSDTEVLVNGWRAWGTGLPERLNGMFAFAIYDRRDRILFLARDRFGEKPLFYGDKGGTFAFASELSAVAAHPRFGRDIDRLALKKYFAYGFLPGATALYRHCHKLPAGHWLRVDLESRRVDSEAYWTFRLDADPALATRTESSLAEELRSHLETAVQRRLMSDVPLGLFLSGGVDSSAVLAMAAAGQSTEPIQTFTIGFDEPTYDESTFARQAADAFSTNHHQQTLDLDACQRLLPEITSRLDEPIGDPSLVPTYLLSGFTREHVKVALSGDGADELFAGYDTFTGLRLARIVDAVVPHKARSAIRRLADLLPRSDSNLSADFKIRRALGGLTYERPLWNPRWLGPLSPEDITELFNEPVDIETLFEEAVAVWNDNPMANLTDQTLAFYTRLYLTDDILVKTDRASMMHGLECRAPFLDPDLVDFICRLPTRFKYQRGERKWLLKQALSGLVPESLLQRKKKGFGIPLTTWLRGLPSVEQVDVGADLDVVRRFERAHHEGHADHRLFLWCWRVLQQQTASLTDSHATLPRDASAQANV
ncbi:MAG: asparagine synthase (glutamine-hydrolyzing) [Pseudomonadota bacterium]